MRERFRFRRPSSRLSKIQLCLFALALLFLREATAQYSTRYALLVGIGEYPKESGWTKINGDRDVQLLAEELKNYSFLPANTIRRTNEKASRELILASLDQLQQRVQSGDIVYIHFSGHFQQVPDLNGDEADGLDECFAAWDSRHKAAGGYAGEGHIRDDELAEKLKRIEEKLTRIGQLLLVFDGGFGNGQRGTSVALNISVAGSPKKRNTGKNYENEWADLSRTENSPHTVSVLPAGLSEPVNETVSGKDSMGTISAFLRNSFRNSSGIRSFGDLSGTEKLSSPRVLLSGSRELEFWPRELSKRKEYSVDVEKNARLQKDSRVFAVCIGVSKYPGENRSLRFAHSDAASFFTALQQVYGEKMVSDSSFLLLNDQATQARVFQLLDRLKNEIRQGDRLYFYFAGHGDVEGSLINKPTFFLLPGGSELSYSSGGHIPFDLLRNYMNTFMFRGAQVYMVVDACHSGNLAGGDEGQQQISNNLKNIDRGESVKILACGPNEKSREGEEFGGGFGAFTWYLLRGMEGKADYDKNKEISVAEIGRFLADSVSSKTYMKQNPLVETAADIGFLPKPGKFSAAELARKKKESQQAEASQATRQLEMKFREQLKKQALVEPAENCALFWLEKLEAATEGQEEKQKRWKEELSDAINTKTQNIINLYIAGNENIVREEVFRLGARDLAVFLEQNPPSHPLYPQMQARRYFFDAQAISPYAMNNARDRKHLDSAISHLRTALRIERRAAHLHNAIGRLYGRTGQYDSAIHYYNRAIALAPRWKFPYNNKGGAYREKFEADSIMQWADSAEISYIKAINLDEKYFLALNNLGWLNYLTSRNIKAKQILQKSTFINRKNADAFHLLSLIYRVEKNWDSAYVFLDLGLSQNPKSTELNLQLANCYFDHACEQANTLAKDSLIKLSKSAFLLVNSIQPEYVNCFFGLSNVYWEEKNYDSSAFFASRAMELDTTDYDLTESLVCCYLRLKKFNEAEKVLKTMDVRFPENGYNSLLWGSLYLAKNDRKRALFYFIKGKKTGISEETFSNLDNWALFKSFPEFKDWRKAQ